MKINKRIAEKINELTGEDKNIRNAIFDFLEFEEDESKKAYKDTYRSIIEKYSNLQKSEVKNDD